MKTKLSILLNLLIIQDLNDYFNNATEEVTNISIQKDNMNKELQHSYKKIEEAKQILDSMDLEIKLNKYKSNNNFELKEDG